jgi:hypothetical protein
VRRWLEFHDSEFVSFDHDGERAVLTVNGYVHQWEQTDSGWRGTGWTQRIQITVLSASVETDRAGWSGESEDCPDIWDGTLHTASVAHENLLALPFAHDGHFRLDIDLNDGRSLRIAGRNIRVEGLGDADFVEKLPQALQPDQTGDCSPWR